MITNILEYLVSDVYYQLWMSATMAGGNKTTFNKEDWHPALVAQFDNPADIPDRIIVKEGNQHHLNGDGNFHLGRNSPSLHIPEMKIFWNDESGDIGRKVGPCKIVLTDVKKWHNDGVLHRRRGDAIICKQATFTWGRHGTFRRDNGPYHIAIRKLSAQATNGSVFDWRMDGIIPTWSTEEGRRLSQIQIKEIASTCEIEINLLANDTVFSSDEDEFIFLTEIAE